MIEVDPRPQDHAVGLELHIVEVVHRAQYAAERTWTHEEVLLHAERDELYSELAMVADRGAGGVICAPQVGHISAEASPRFPS